MNKIYNWCAQNIDKIAHGAVCAFLFMVVAEACRVAHWDWAAANALAMFTTAAVGLAKECVDYFCGRGMDAEDFLADAIGACVASIFFITISVMAA